MTLSAAMVMAVGLSALGGSFLAVLLWRQGDTAVGARPLAAFIALVGVWSIGLLLPTPLGEALMCLAPLGGAVFVHFCARLTGRSGAGIRWAYGLGGLAMVLAMTAGSGHAVSVPGGAVFRYEGAGLLAGAVTVGLAAYGHRLLALALRSANAIERRQILLVLLSSMLGLFSITGLCFPVLGIDAYPWPLLLQPLYLVVLAYAVLRYRLMDVNRWAVRAVCFGLLIGLAAVVSALSAGLAAEKVGVSFAWTAIALLTGLALAAPLRRLADRIVYPGGEMTADDLARWRQALREAQDETQLTETAHGLLRQHLGFSDLSASDAVAQAPPGPRRVAMVMTELMELAKDDLIRRRAFVERQRLAELGALAATVAHDLRNPMNIIAMAVADAPPDTRGEVKAQLARMEALARDLLDYAKPWRVDAVTLDLATVLAPRGIAFEVDIPHGFTVKADPDRLRQALANLLDNARAAGGRVLVAAEQCPDAVYIHVCDDGPGIPEDIRTALFQPFVSRSQGGTGLGLAIVAKVMAAHGGAVTVTARPGWTTCFTLRFPS